MKKPAIIIAASVLLFGHCACLIFGQETRANASPLGTRHQVTGLFCEERAKDLERVFEKLPQMKLKRVDFDKAEIVVEYDCAMVFPESKTDEQRIQRFDSVLRQASNHTFGIKPLSTVPEAKLTLVEIPIVGLDCKACSLAAYEAVYRIQGVERATASFKEGRVTAMIDAEQTNRDELEKALKQRGVTIGAATGKAAD
jgi:cation transport ATPase